MSASFRSVLPLRRLAVLLTAGTLVAGCLPDEGDVAAKYTAINQRASVENIAESLAVAAQNMASYYTAAEMRRKAPLEDGKIIDPASGPTVTDNPMPQTPANVKVVRCGKYGVMSYFTSVPKGIHDMKKQGETMTATLALRFGNDAVGAATAGGVQLSKKGQTLGCPAPSDAAVGSPIFISGFTTPKDSTGADLAGLPDPRKTKQPIFKRDITLPCPAGKDGVIKREQICELKFSDTEATKENTKIKIGKAGSEAENDVQRLTKKWECTPDNTATLPPPTPQEEEVYCRDPSKDIAKQADNAIEMKADSLKQVLEASGPGYYSFYCRKNKDGTDTCDAKPFTAPPRTYLQCDTTNPKEQYVINPVVPLKLAADGTIVSATPGAVVRGTPPVGTNDCGKGWKGDLIAGYKVRQCELIKDEGGVKTVLNKAQTVYRIGYVAAKCANAASKEASYICPSPYKGNVILRESFAMTRPIALQLGPAPEPGKWTSSTIAWKRGFFGGNATLETLTRSLTQGYRVANEENLDTLENPLFTSRLESVMDATEYLRPVTGCKLAQQTCKLPPDPIRVGFVFDRSRSMREPTPAKSNVNNTVCQARLQDIFSDQNAACAIVRRHNIELNNSETGGEYDVERQLAAYLVSSKYYALLHNALEAHKDCIETISDEIGYCLDPNGPENQSTCAPGRCIKSPQQVGGSRLNVALAQLGVGISQIPPGSDFKYTQYLNNNVTNLKKQFCNEKDDASCDHAIALKSIKDGLTTSNDADGETPLMKATVEALNQFEQGNNPNMPQILFFFTDGGATDSELVNSSRKDYPYPFAGFCNEERRNDRETCDIAGISGRSLSEGEALTAFQQAYISNNCSSSTPPAVCYGITLYYNGVADTLRGAAWKDCENFVTQPYPSAIDYIKSNYPSVKVFILNLGSPDLAACENKQGGNIQYLDASTPTAFEDAFGLAFESDGQSANPLEVCQKMRATYPSAVNY